MSPTPTAAPPDAEAREGSKLGSRIARLVRHHPLVAFFGLAYAISWGSYYILAGPFGFPFGPLLAAIIVASVTRGRTGLTDWLRRSLRWRVGPTWYAAALGIPVAIGLASVALNVLLGAPVPAAAQLGPWYGLLLLFPVAMIDAPLAEESGWRGYALPQMSAGRSPLANTLVLAAFVAGWHLPVALAGGAVAIPYLIAGVGGSVLINWVYYHARESALLAILFHTAANTMGLYFRPMISADPDLARYYWLLAALNCVVAIGVVFFDWNTWRSRRPAAPAPAARVAAIPAVS